MRTSRIVSLIAVGAISLPLLAGTTSPVAANPRTTPPIGTQLAKLKGSDLLAANALPGRHATGEVTSNMGWSIQTIPNPAGAQDAYLSGVSCKSTTACTAVGYSQNPDTAPSGLTLAEAWNGSKWVIEPTPAAANVHAYLSGISCTSVTACTAVGYYVNGTLNTTTLAEAWNGSKWLIEPTPNPGGSLASRLSGVSCASATACIAVGKYFNSAGIELTLAEAWNGTRWAIEPTPDPTGTYIGLSGVSCASALACTAVGSYVGSNPPLTHTLAEAWNGTRWAIEPIASVKNLESGLGAISCTSATVCTAVGWIGSVAATRTLAETWDGTNWTIHATPNPGLSQYYDLRGVACTSATACTAIGQAYDPGGKNDVTLALGWNGSKWVMEPTPNPAGGGVLSGVSCSSPTVCTAVGSYENSSGTSFTLAETTSTGTEVTITSIAPDSGPTDGGMPVTITGTNLSSVSSVYFGTAVVDTVNSCSSTACTVYLPAHAVGEVNVKATTSTGRSSNDTVTFTYGTPDMTISPPFSYTFTAPIDQLSPAQTFTITNSGTTDIELAEDHFVGSTAGDFGNASDDDVCASVLLAPKQTCPLSVVFSDPTIGVPKAGLDIFDGAQKQVAAIDLGGASTGPIVTSVTKVPQMASPVLVITGTGFGESTADLHLHAKTKTPYFELADGTNWTAGDSRGTCDATIDEWSTTTIIVTPVVGGLLSPCPLDVGHSLSVTIKNTANTTYSASRSTPVISTSGLTIPSVKGLSQDHGPQSGGGGLTITGTGLSGVNAVEFGPYGTTDVTPSASGTSVTVNKVPSATVAQGVSVSVTTEDGLSSSPSKSCWLPNLYLTYCSDSYFYLSEQKFSYAADGAFDNTLSVGPSGETGDGDTKTGSQPPQQGESDSDDSQACAGEPSLSGSLSLETQGTAEAVASGQLGVAANGLLLSAMLGNGTLDMTKVETTVTLSGSTSGEVDAPILGVPCVFALYDRVTGSIDASVSLGMTLTNLAVTFTGGFVNGQLVGPEERSAGSFTITCDGQPLTGSNARSCIAFQPPTGSVQGSLAVSLWLQAGPDQANIGIGPQLTFNGSANTAGTVSWGACLGLDADAEVDVGPLSIGGTAELINPQIALKGTC